MTPRITERIFWKGNLGTCDHTDVFGPGAAPREFIVVGREREVRFRYLNDLHRKEHVFSDMFERVGMVYKSVCGKYTINVIND